MNRFIILCHQRSGSTLLVLALRQNPRAFVQGELLGDNEEQKQRWFNVDGRYFRGPDDDAVAFLRDCFFASHPSALAIGFKLMHYHARAGRAAAVWDYLASETGIRIIHLHRENLLETVVSDLVANRSGQWSVPVNHSEGIRDVPPFSIELKDCRRRFQELETWRDSARSQFAHHPFLEVRYEDLTADFAGTLDRVWAFLETPPHPAKQRLIKQAHLPLRQQIENFEELRSSFAGSRWERFFAD
jgi:LPS sulfotransferase NodH